MRNCPNCHTSLPEDAEFCFNCGKRLSNPPAPETKTCPRCGTPALPADGDFCAACGFPLNAPALGPDEPRSPTPEAVPGEKAADASPTEQMAAAEAELPYKTATPREPGQLELARTAPEMPIRLHSEQASQALPPVDKTTQAGGRRRFTTNLPVRRRLIGVLILVLLAVAAAIALWPPPPPPPSVVACQPLEPPDDYEAANQIDLEGDLRRNSYFRDGEEYVISPDATFRIPNGLTLIIEPGARVRFGRGARMVVEGTLSACGRGSSPILFTAASEAGAPGFWSGIEFREADEGTVLGHATLEFGGAENHAVVWVAQCEIQLEDLRFSTNAWYPLSLDPDSYPRVREELEVEAGPTGWEVRGGTLTRERTWTADEAMIVNGVVEVSEQAALTLPAGATVKFLPGSALRTLGALTAEGARDAPVVFTAVNDGAEEGAPEPLPGDWMGLQWVGREGTSQLLNVEIRYAGAAGNQQGCLWLSDAAPRLENVRVLNCAGFALSTDLASEPELVDLRLDQTDVTRRWELRESRLSGVAQRTFAPLQAADDTLLIPLVTGWVGVEEDAKLTLEAGATFLFTGGGQSGLWVDGTLNANGTESEPVLLTSWRDPAIGGVGTAVPGEWGGVHVNRATPQDTRLAGLVIRYAGAVEHTCLRLLGSSPRLEDVTIQHCAAFPLSSDAAAMPEIVNLTLADNSLGNLWEILRSSLDERRTWSWAPVVTTDGAPLLRQVTGGVMVEQESTLRLEPGLTLTFGPEGYLLIRGGIQASGTERQPVLLTSWRDASAGTTESGPQPGDWRGLILDGTQAAQTLDFVQVRYAGNEREGIACLSLNSASPAINGLEISHCSYYPVGSNLTANPHIGTLRLQDNLMGDAWAVWESRLERGGDLRWEALYQSGSDTPLSRVVTGWLTIEPGARLEMDEGVVLRFNQGVGMTIRGSLVVDASAGNPAVLTSWRDPQYSQEGGVLAGDWSGMRLENPQGEVRLDGLELRYAGGREGALFLTNAAPVIGYLRVRDSASYPLSLDIQSVPQIEQLELVDNRSGNAVEVRSSTLERAGELIWAPFPGSPQVVRVVTGWLRVGQAATLRIDPDTLVKFAPEGGLEVRGGLNVSEATLTALYDLDLAPEAADSRSGDRSWLGIRLLARRPVRLEDSLVRYAQTGLWLENAAPVLVDVQIERCWEAALSADVGSAPEVENVSLVGNALNGLVLRATSLPDGDTTWARLGSSADQVVRILANPLVIGPRSQLVVEAGVVVKFASQAGMILEGQLTAAGTEDEPVILTTLNDDQAGGDTDGIQQTPSRGAWAGVNANPNNTGVRLVLEWVEIRYATNGLYLTNLPDWVYTDLRIADSLLYGISCDVESTFDPAAEGIRLENNGSETTGCPTPDR